MQPWKPSINGVNWEGQHKGCQWQNRNVPKMAMKSVPPPPADYLLERGGGGQEKNANPAFAVPGRLGSDREHGHGCCTNLFQQSQKV